MSNKPKLQSFRKSVANLKSILVEAKTGIVRDAAIKRYELCYELSWKSVQEAYADMVQNRNLTTHTYNEDLADEIYNNLGEYLSLFESLVVKLEAQRA
jgi:hypothetical protein